MSAPAPAQCPVLAPPALPTCSLTMRACPQGASVSETQRRPSPAPETGELNVTAADSPFEAICQAAPGAALFIQAGRYCWGQRGDGVAEEAVAHVAGELHVRGKEAALMWGPWSLASMSSGDVRGIHMPRAQPAACAHRPYMYVSIYTCI